MKFYQFTYVNQLTGKTGLHTVRAMNQKDAQDKWDRYVAPFNDYRVVSCYEVSLLEYLQDETPDEDEDRYTLADLGNNWW